MDASNFGQSSRKNTFAETSRPSLISAAKINNGASHKFQSVEFSCSATSPSPNTTTANTTSYVLPERSMSAERKRPSTPATQPVPVAGARLPESMRPSAVRSHNDGLQSDKLSRSNKKSVGPSENTLLISHNSTPERKRVTGPCEDSKPLTKVSSDSSTISIGYKLDNADRASNASSDGSGRERLEQNLVDNTSLRIPNKDHSISSSRSRALNPAFLKGLTKRINIDRLRNSKALEGFHMRLKWPSSTILKVSSNSVTKSSDTDDMKTRASNSFDGSEQEESVVNDISPQVPKIGYSSSCPTSPEKAFFLSPSSVCSVSPSQMKASNQLEPHIWPRSTIVKVPSKCHTRSNSVGLIDEDLLHRRMSFPDFASTSPKKLDSDSISLVLFEEREGEKMDDDFLWMPNNISSSSCPVSPDQAFLSPSSVSSVSPSQSSVVSRAPIRGVSSTPSRAIRGVSLTPSTANRGVSPTRTRASRGVSPTPTKATRGVSPTPTRATRGVSPTPTRATRGVNPTPTRATRGVSPTPTRATRGVSPTPTKTTRGVSLTPTKDLCTTSTKEVNQTSASISSVDSIKEANPSPAMSTKEDRLTLARVLRGVHPTPSNANATKEVTPKPSKVTRGVSPTPTRASRGVSPTPTTISSVLSTKKTSTTPTMTTKEVNPTPTKTITGVSLTPASVSSVMTSKGTNLTPIFDYREVSRKLMTAFRGANPTSETHTTEVTRNPTMMTKMANSTPTTAAKDVSSTLTKETAWLNSTPTTPTTPTIGVSPTPILETIGASPTPTIDTIGAVRTSTTSGEVSPTPITETRGISQTSLVSTGIIGLGPTPTMATRGINAIPTRAARGVSPTPITLNRGVNLTPSRSTRGVSLTPTTTTTGVSQTPTRPTRGVSPTPSTISIVSSPSRVDSTPRTLNLASKRGVSPARIRAPDPPTPKATRGASPTPFRPSSPMRESSRSTIDFNFIVDVKKVNKDSNHAEDIHQLRLLDNVHLQWRHANARAEKLLYKQKVAAEKILYSLWRTNSELSDLVTEKKIDIEELNLKLKLYSILYNQIIYLKEWTLVEKSHASVLSKSIQDIQKTTLSLPVVGGARVNIHSLKGAVCSAVDLMQRIGSSVSFSLARVEGVNALVSELARVTAEERAVLEECEALFSTADLMQVEEYSLRARLVQFKQASKDDEL